MKRTLSLALLAALFLGLFMFSCNKNSNTDDAAIDATIAVDNSVTEGVILANKEAKDSSKATKDTACYTVERHIDWQNRKGYVTITFNPQCDPEGRSGKMTIIWDLGWRIHPNGKQLTIKYENFVRRKKVFNGTIQTNIEVNFALDSTASVVFHTTLDSFSVEFPDGTSFLVSGQKDITYYGFFTFFNRFDNILVVNSNLQGVNRRGNSFVSVADSVVYKGNCEYRFPVAGTKTITINDKRTYLIDFGDGTCDNVYTVTVDGKTETRTWGD